MNERDRMLISEFKSSLPADLRRHLKRLIVFGSRSRGEVKEDSDLDAVVLVDERTPEVERQFEDIAYQVMWDNDFKPIISLKVFSEFQFYDALKRGFSFYKHIEKEGISV